MLVLLGTVRMRAHRAGLIGLAVAVAVGSLAYGMPLGQNLAAGARNSPTAPPHWRARRR
ncbi:hypothetical protein [Streptomyces sp. NPDC058240]|uniref:hypothetical protein n=1 Tax=Streptomyces sp. NPDC058240 TaxID=3346396 RepID=UPI0036E4C21E